MGNLAVDGQGASKILEHSFFCTFHEGHWLEIWKVHCKTIDSVGLVLQLIAKSPMDGLWGTDIVGIEVLLDFIHGFVVLSCQSGPIRPLCTHTCRDVSQLRPSCISPR